MNNYDDKTCYACQIRFDYSHLNFRECLTTKRKIENLPICYLCDKQMLEATEQTFDDEVTWDIWKKIIAGRSAWAANKFLEKTKGISKKRKREDGRSEISEKQKRHKINHNNNI